MFLLTLEKYINRFSDLLGLIAAFLMVLLVFNVFFDVVMRYAFNDVSIGMQEMEWHLFAAIFMLGVPYALRCEGHVRVDVIYEKLSLRNKAMIDIFGTLVFLLPFTLLVGWYGVPYAYEAFEINEGSGDPGGLPYRWIIKGVIPFAFFAMAISGIGLLLKSINTLLGYHDQDPPAHHTSGRLT